MLNTTGRTLVDFVVVIKTLKSDYPRDMSEVL